VISDDWKFVYVEVRNAASTSIRQLLFKRFNVSFYHCPVQKTVFGDCTVLQGRCSSLCLNQSHIEDYFFFTFVRDPLQRFVSGYKEAWKQRFRSQGIMLGNVSHVKDVLDVIVKEHYHSDQHLESMSMSVSMPWQDASGNRYRVPMDFIGRIENLEQDITLLQNLLREKTNRTPSLNFHGPFSKLQGGLGG
jgi:hypothetical protein